MKILLAEDDHSYNESIKEYLELLGHEVDAFYDGAPALDAVYTKDYHLLLLDIKMPNLDGYRLMQHLQKIKCTTPIIIITSLIDIDSISKGYILGCNDYLKKPFELKELELRLHEVVKKYYHTDNDGKIKISENLYFDFEGGRLVNNHTEISLTHKERDLIAYLLRKRNHYCSIDVLRDVVWEGKEILDADIRMHIRKLRIKVGEEFIQSARGLGYRIDLSC
jgi:DNA-binding response OmpR family regulator